MGNYITSSEVIAEGAPSGTPVGVIDSRIVKWEALVEKITGNIFRILTPGELTFDGNNSGILHFNLPLITVSSVKVNGDSTALDTDEYRAFTGRMPPQDNRQNPKIRLTPISGTIYRTQPSMFVKGLDQLITSTWGYVEADDSTPRPIVDALLRLVLLDLDNYFTQGSSTKAVTPKKREKTDGHELEWMELVDLRTAWSILPQDVAEILAIYRSPWVIAAPEPQKFFVDPGIDVMSF